MEKELKKNRLKRKIHFFAMLNMVVLANVAGVILVMVIVLGANYYRYMKDETRNSLQSKVEQAEVYVSDYMNGIANSAENLAADTRMGEALEAYLRADNLAASVNGKSTIDYILDNALKSNSNIEHITLLSEDHLVMRDQYGGVLTNPYMNNIYDEEWFHELCAGEIIYKLEECTFYSDPQDPCPYYFYATKFKNKYYSPRNKEEKLVIIIFKIEELKNYINAIASNEYINISVCEETEDGDKQIIHQTNPNEVMVSYFTDSLQDEKQKNSIKNNYIFMEKKVDFIQWRVIGDVSKSSFSKMVYQVEPWMVLAILIVLMVSILVSTVSARIVSKPIKRLVQAMKDMEDSKFHAVESETSCIEIEQLNFTYNQMSNKIEELIENIRIQEEERRRIEFKMLEAQINPHFIYNTLDAIKWVAHINRADKVVTILESFVRLLRISLSSGKEVISVESEIKLIREYVNIMIFRNNYETEITYDIAKESEECYTLKLVLQPFVENSFFHAFGDGKRVNRISIRSWIEENVLVFEVTDNGSGFSVEHKKGKQQMTGIGIDNIDDRIKVWYGEEYGVKITSQKDCGTTVIIRQPIMRKEEIYGIDNDCGG